MVKKIIETEVVPFFFLLPKRLEEGEYGKKVRAILNSHLAPVILGSDYVLPSFQISKSILKALNLARRTGRLIRGFEDAEKKLKAERAGIVYADKKTGMNRKERISRVIVVASDGSERFYRQTKKLVKQNRPRVLAIHLDITSFELGEWLFGKGKRVLFLLINHKNAVISFLTSLIR